MGWSIDIGVVSTHKYAIKESGDVVEIVDLPDGGLGLVVADGQGSGPAARLVARSTAAQAWSLLQQGVRPDGVAAAVSDALFSSKGGKVSVSLDVARIDRNGSIEIARLSTNVLLTWSDDRWQVLKTSSEPAGRYDLQIPKLQSIAPGGGCAFVIITDGVADAGRTHGGAKTIHDFVPDFDPGLTATLIAERTFDDALARENGRPGDDMTVVVCLLNRSQRDQRVERRSLHREVR
jgi:serine phosphatase RsbU (regulator of sigma subunit)